MTTTFHSCLVPSPLTVRALTVNGGVVTRSAQSQYNVPVRKSSNSSIGAAVHARPTRREMTALIHWWTDAPALVVEVLKTNT